MENSELVSHVFHKSVMINLIQCFTWCVDDCRCLSFNCKENKEGKVCELNEGSHFTNQSSLIHSLGSRYYILNRTSSQKEGDIGGYPIPQYRTKKWQIPKYRFANRLNTDTAYFNCCGATAGSEQQHNQDLKEIYKGR